MSKEVGQRQAGFIIIDTEPGKALEVSEEMAKTAGVKSAKPVIYDSSDTHYYMIGRGMCVAGYMNAVIVRTSVNNWGELKNIQAGIEANSDVLSSLPLLAVNSLEGFSIR